MEDISNVVFHTITGMSYMRYFKVQKISLEHERDERAIKKTLIDETCRGFDGIAMDPD